MLTAATPPSLPPLLSTIIYIQAIIQSKLLVRSVRKFGQLQWGYGWGGGRSQHSPLFGHFLRMEVSITQKNGADSQHSQQQIWPSKSASTQKIEQIVSIRKKLNPQIQLIFSQALRDQAIKSVKTSSGNSIVGLDYAPLFLQLEEVPTPLY